MITPAHPLPIEIVDDDLPVPAECIDIVASLLLDAIDAEDSTGDGTNVTRDAFAEEPRR